MNLNLTVKSAVAAALLGAVALPAFATSVTPPASGPVPVPSAGPGGLIVEVWDAATGHSLAEWLGPDSTSFAIPAAGQTLDYGVLGGSAFGSLFSATDISGGNVQFMVAAVNDFTPATPTIDFTVATLGKMTGSAAGGFASSINTGISAILNGANACNNLNPCTATGGATDPHYAVTNLGLTAIGASKISGLAGGPALTFYQIVSNGSSLGTQTPTQFANANGAATWTLSAAGDLVLSAPGGSAVPLPAAVWLLGSGLLGLVGIGRRKVALA